MPVWRIGPIADEPSVSLTDWQVMALPNGERHFVGYAVEAREGLTSSAVVTLDIATMCGISRSGRVYRLCGRPGGNADGAYTWRRWVALNNVVAWTDVSKELWALHQASPLQQEGCTLFENARLLEELLAPYQELPLALSTRRCRTERAANVADGAQAAAPITRPAAA